MAGRDVDKVVIGIAGELRQGLHDEHAASSVGGPTAPSPTRRWSGSSRSIEADASAEAQRTITWETGPAQRRRAARPCRGRRRRRGRLRGHQPGRLPGPPPAHLGLQRLRAARPPRRARIGRRAARASQLIKVVAEPYAVARSISGEQVGQSGALFIDVGGGTTDVAMVRSGSVEGTRMFALGGRAFTKSLADRLDLSFEDAERIKIDHAQGRAVDRRGRRRRRSSAEDVAVWAAGIELVLEEFGKRGPAARSHRALRRRSGAARDPRRARGRGRSGPACPSRDDRRSP